MYAIVETGGKQYQVEEGRYLDVELLGGEKDEKVVFDKVIMIVNGAKSKVGQPYVKGASVEGSIVKHDKAKKIIVYKQRPKKKGQKNGIEEGGRLDQERTGLGSETVRRKEIRRTGSESR